MITNQSVAASRRIPAAPVQIIQAAVLTRLKRVALSRCLSTMISTFWTDYFRSSFVRVQSNICHSLIHKNFTGSFNMHINFICASAM